MPGAPCVTKPFPPARQIVIDAGWLAARRHLIHALLELDVTPVRQRLHAHKAATGESLSFTAFIVERFARAIDQDRRVQAYRSWRNQLVIFDEVDVVTLIETERGGVALPHIIRSANHRTLRDIHDEIRAVQAHPDRSAQSSRLSRLAPRLPAFARRLGYRYLLADPQRFKRFSGTCVVTSVGMFGQGSGWGIGFLPLHTLGLTVGSIAGKPGVIDGRLEVREYLHLTITFDHDLVDGAPAARFAQRLTDAIQAEDALTL